METSYIGNALVALVPYVVLDVVASVGEELGEHLGVQVTSGLCFGVVGHEVDDEVVCSRGHNSGRHERGKVVRVLLDGAVGVLGEELRELIEGKGVLGASIVVGVAEAVPNISEGKSCSSTDDRLTECCCWSVHLRCWCRRRIE